MVGERRPLFRKSKVRKVPTSLGTPAGKEPSPSTAATAATSTSNAEKWHPKWPPLRKGSLDLPADSVNIPSPGSIREMPHFPSGSLPEDGADSGPKKNEKLQGENEKLKTTLDAVQKENKEAQEQYIKDVENLALLYSRYTPVDAENMGLTSRLKNAQMMADFSKKRTDETARKLKAVEEVVPWKIEEAIRGYQFSKDFRREAGKDSTYYLCRFTRTYKEVNPGIVDNYREFIQGYDEEWFANYNLDAPLTPREEDHEGPLPETAEKDDAPAS
ncbi:hypothetical protein LIER_24592 [Lithospermum erythrorhizon]|uniref:Uncharacterized protein n=1 Tax=Lithospermum erythrorhizon TaxID=34254 RepID=A0AAV3R4P7_LITER